MTFLSFESFNASPQAIEYILNNIAFVSLLIMTIWHWARLIYSLQFLPITIGTVGIAIANLSLGVLLEIRWVESGHFPLSNLYESLLFLAWGFTTFHLLLEQLTKVQFVGVVTAPVALLITGFASFSLPKEMQRATALIPALQSNWLMMHVTIMMMSYVALLGGSLLAIAFLVVNLYTQQNERQKDFETEPSVLDSISHEQLSNYSKAKVQEFTNLGTGKLRGETAQDKAPLNNPVFGFRYQERVSMSTPSSMELMKDPSLCHHFTKQSEKSERGVGNLSKDRVPLSTIQQFESNSRPLMAPQITQVEGQRQGNNFTEGRSGSRCAPTLEIDSFVLTSSSIDESNTNTSTLAQTLDNLSYRTLGFGFPLLTIGILSGAVWANEAWGSYWSWDPKETWAFITWLVFAIYLHTRLTKGWKGTAPALIAAGGFVIVWICYLGVNLLGTGLHSYGWFQRS
jgi:ABC-type transport system involved in cytochrome c biogenesis permease subunit